MTPLTLAEYFSDPSLISKDTLVEYLASDQSLIPKDGCKMRGASSKKGEKASAGTIAIWSDGGIAAKRGGRETSTQGREEEREGERERKRSADCRLVSARDLWLFALPQSPALNIGGAG